MRVLREQGVLSHLDSFQVYYFKLQSKTVDTLDGKEKASAYPVPISISLAANLRSDLNKNFHRITKPIVHSSPSSLARLVST